MVNEELLLIPALVFSCSVLTLYYIYFYSRIFCSKDYSIQFNKNCRSMRAWVDRHLKKQDASTVQQAVQSLRNMILVGAFVGGNAVNVAFNSANSIDPRNFQSFDYLIYMKDVRALIIAVLLFGSFLNWILVMRYAGELSFVIDFTSEAQRLALALNPSPSFDESLHNSLRAEKIGKLANKLIFHFSVAFRFMYASIPFAFLSVGPIALIVSTVVMMAFHYDHDFGKYSIKD